MKKIILTMVMVLVAGSVSNVFAMADKVARAGLSPKQLALLEGLKSNEVEFNNASKKFGFSFADYQAWLQAKGQVVLKPATAPKPAIASTSTSVPVTAPVVYKQSTALVSKPAIGSAVTNQPGARSTQLAVDNEELFFNLIKEADQARTIPAILAFKAQASKIPGIAAGRLGFFDHLVDTLPRVLEERARQEIRFRDEISIKNLLILDTAKAAIQEIDLAKKQRLANAIVPQLDIALRNLQHYYFEIVDRGLRERVMELFIKLKVARLALTSNELVIKQPDKPKPVATEETYYTILGIARNASPNDIKVAYRKLAVKYHPDKIAQSGLTKEKAEQAFFKLSEAHGVLSDVNARANYDKTL